MNGTRRGASAPRSAGSARAARRLGACVALVALATGCNAGVLLPLAGDGSSGNTGDAGPATQAQLVTPGATVAVPGGGFYALDESSCVIRKVDGAGTITTVAGTGTCGESGDGGPATAAEIDPGTLGSHEQLALDGAGNLYLAEPQQGRIRRIDASGTISTVGGDGSASDACSGASLTPTALDVGPDGSTLYVACPSGVGVLHGDGSVTNLYTSTDIHPFINLIAAGAPGTVYFGGTRRIVGLIYRLDTTTGVATDMSPVGGWLLRALAADTAGNVYFAGQESVVVGTFNPEAVMRIEGDGVTETAIAGNGQPDPADSAQSGRALDLPLSPEGLALTPLKGLLVTSGHVVYRLEDPAHAG
jgi:hypothetical protein